MNQYCTGMNFIYLVGIPGNSDKEKKKKGEKTKKERIT